MVARSAAAEPLIALARVRTPAARERLLQGLALFCDQPQAGRSAIVRDLINDIFLILVADAERDIRQRLAETLAEARWAPSGMVNQLALDDIDIARPIIARSPVLTDDDLLRILVVASIEHQIEVARRPDIGAEVVNALVATAEPTLLTALAVNPTAKVGAQAMRELVAASRQITGLRGPLARHPALSTELAYVMYTWVGETLRSELGRRFALDPELLRRAMSAAVSQAFGSPGGPAPSVEDIDRQEMENRLIAKLQAAGQLRPGFLLKALRDGKLYLFEVALASLANVRTADIRAASASAAPELLALACAAVGIDRSVFPTILSLVRSLNDGRPVGREESLREINAAFTHRSGSDALDAFRAGVAALDATPAPPRQDRAG